MGLRPTNGDEELSPTRSRDRSGNPMGLRPTEINEDAGGNAARFHLFFPASSTEFFMAPFGATTRDEIDDRFLARHFQGSGGRVTTAP
jgi:hypothetical protein